MLVDLLSIVAVSLLAQASNGLQLPEQYIDGPLIKGKIESGSLDHNLIGYLNLSADTSPEMVMGQFASFITANNRKESSDLRTAKSLLELDNGGRNCSRELAHEFLIRYQAYKTTKQTEAHPEVMLNFLEHYGRKKFPACAREAIAEIKCDLSEHKRLYDRPVKFFRLALSLDGWALSFQLHRELRRFKPLESGINVDNLAPVCERETPNESAAERIKRKFDTMCDIVMSLNTKAMNILNLANHFAPERMYIAKNPRIGALNEMRRRCLEVRENDTLLEHLRKLCKPEHDSIFPLDEVL